MSALLTTTILHHLLFIKTKGRPMGAPTMVVGGWLADTAQPVPTVSTTFRGKLSDLLTKFYIDINQGIIKRTFKNIGHIGQKMPLNPYKL